MPLALAASTTTRSAKCSSRDSERHCRDRTRPLPSIRPAPPLRNHPMLQLEQCRRMVQPMRPQRRGVGRHGKNLPEAFGLLGRPSLRPASPMRALSRSALRHLDQPRLRPSLPCMRLYCHHSRWRTALHKRMAFAVKRSKSPQPYSIYFQ